MTIKYVSTVKPASAKGLVGRVYNQIKREFGAVVEPFTVHSSVPELLTGVWSACRETLLVGRVRREVKEAVALQRFPESTGAPTVLTPTRSCSRQPLRIGYLRLLALESQMKSKIWPSDQPSIGLVRADLQVKRFLDHRLFRKEKPQR